MVWGRACCPDRVPRQTEADRTDREKVVPSRRMTRVDRLWRERISRMHIMPAVGKTGGAPTYRLGGAVLGVREHDCLQGAWAGFLQVGIGVASGPTDFMSAVMETCGQTE